MASKPRKRRLRPNFDNALSGFEKIDNATEIGQDLLEERLFSAIPDSEPEQEALIAGAVGKVKKILVFADENPLIIVGKAPNNTVFGLCEANVKNMSRLDSGSDKRTRERGWQLVIYQEFHEATATME